MKPGLTVCEAAGRPCYGSAWQDDFLLCNPASLPRYGHLARKALMHYAGDRYNPETDISTELFVRGIIHELVTYKVFYETVAYDWEWIDHCLKQVIGGCLKLDLPYNQDRLAAGFIPEAKTQLLADGAGRH